MYFNNRGSTKEEELYSRMTKMFGIIPNYVGIDLAHQIINVCTADIKLDAKGVRILMSKYLQAVKNNAEPAVFKQIFLDYFRNVPEMKPRFDSKEFLVTDLFSNANELTCRIVIKNILQKVFFTDFTDKADAVQVISRLLSTEWEG